MYKTRSFAVIPAAHEKGVVRAALRDASHDDATGRSFTIDLVSPDYFLNSSFVSVPASARGPLTLQKEDVMSDRRVERIGRDRRSALWSGSNRRQMRSDRALGPHARDEREI